MKPHKRIHFLILVVAIFIGQSYYVQPSIAQLSKYPHPMSYYVTDYNFSQTDVTTKMSTFERDNLRYYIENVASVIPPEFDAQLVIWWAYIEGILNRENGPWGFSNCADKNFHVSTDCVDHFKSGAWQVGYGVQVFDHIKRLEKAFNYAHKDKYPWEIGDAVFTKSGQTGIRFPKDLTLSQIMREPKSNTADKSNAYWASVLMRDPKISACLLAENLTNWNCYGKMKGKTIAVPKWCGKGTHYSKNKDQHSSGMNTIIKTWH